MDNLLPHLNEFTNWSPTTGQTPKFFKESEILGICGEGNPNNFGKWTTIVPVCVGMTYEAVGEYKADDPASVYMLVNWRDKDGEYIQRDFPDLIDGFGSGEDGWVRLCCKACAPEGAIGAEIELTFNGPGRVLWRNVAFYKTDPVVPRPVRIASTFFTPRYDLTKNLDVMLELADQAGQMQADVILFTESGYDRGIMPIEAKVVSFPGDITDKFAEKAVEYNSNILVNLTEEENGIFFNTTAWIDRTGKIAGKYRKVHLPISEQEIGFSRGDGLPVFETDIGTAGILTCYDIDFFESGRTLRNKGAEIVFVPTIGNYLMSSQMQAKWNGFYVVVSGAHVPQPSRIINPNGEIIAAADGTTDGLAFAEIDLSEGTHVQGMGFWPAVSDARNAMLWQRREDLY